jgi:tetratricopeptide (TPR) repeat protein
MAVNLTTPSAPPTLPPAGPALPWPLAQRALDALSSATQATGDQAAPVIEERAVYRPDSWLIQKCWEALAAGGATGGAAEAALQVAQMAGQRQPLAPIQALYRLSQQIDRRLGLASIVGRVLAARAPGLLAPGLAPGDSPAMERLLYAAATAANLGDRYQAFAFLERLDQFQGPWARAIVAPEQRALLADTIFRAGLQPLTAALIATALRRSGDAGAQFVLQITTAASGELQRHHSPARMARVLALGVETFRNATLTSLYSRRLTAVALAQAGLVDEVLTQLTAIANIQAARREGGLGLRKGDPAVLRQVKRPTADADVDFQVYTMQEVVRALPLRQVSREQRIELANRLAFLGTRSDGWTAASAAATLVTLGAIKFAVEVVEQIPAKDPTRAEGTIELVRGLLRVDEATLAQEQEEKGLAWARTYPGRNPERALVWGLAEVYLDQGRPERALALLATFGAAAGFGRWWRDLFGRRRTIDELRTAGLRLRALLQQDAVERKELERLVIELRTWAPRLLEGEALVSYLVQNLLTPLLATGRTRLGLTVLPPLQEALRSGSGEKHAARVGAAAQVLVRELALPPAGMAEPGAVDPGAVVLPTTPLDPGVRAALEQFLTGIWEQDSRRGLWQTVHGIEGSLPLLLALEGPEAVAGLARSVNEIGVRWGR